jgi:hypothetical protein
MDDIEKLIDGLEPERARDVLKRLEDITVTRPDREAAIREALSRAANRRRAQHARRLFTEVLHPVLVADARAEALGWDAPGLLHRIDAAALWALLATGAPAVVARVQSELARRARAAPLDEVMALPESVAMADELCSAGVAALDALLADRRSEAALERLNALRADEARRRRVAGRLRPWAARDAAFMRDLLVMRDMAMPLLAPEATAMGARGWPGGDAAVASFAGVVAGTGRSPVLAALAPLTALNRSGDFGPAVRFLSTVTEERACAVLLDGIARHVEVVSAAFADRLSALTGVAGAGPLVLPADRVAGIAAALDAFERAMGACAGLDLLASPRVGARCRDALAALLSRVEKGPYKVLLARVEACSRLLPAPDHEAVAAMLGVVQRWRAGLSDQVFWGSGHTEFKDDAQATLRAAFKRALAPETHPGPIPRFGHLRRIEELARGVGVSVARWLDPPNPGFVRAATERLAAPEPLHPVEADLVRAAVASAQAELAKIRHWKDAALVALVEAAGRRPDA